MMARNKKLIAFLLALLLVVVWLRPIHGERLLSYLRPEGFTRIVVEKILDDGYTENILASVELTPAEAVQLCCGISSLRLRDISRNTFFTRTDLRYAAYFYGLRELRSGETGEVVIGEAVRGSIVFHGQLTFDYLYDDIDPVHRRYRVVHHSDADLEDMFEALFP